MNRFDFLTGAVRKTWGEYRTYGVLLPAAVAAGAFFNVMPAMLLKEIVDQVASSRADMLWKLAFAYLGAVALIGLADFLREYGATVFGQRVLLNVRNGMLRKLTRLPVRYFNTTPKGETMARLTADIDAINSLFVSGVVAAAADLFKIAGFLAALFLLSPYFGMVALAGVPAVYALSDYFRKRIYQKQVVVRRRVAEINTRIQEIYTGLPMIKSYGAESYFAGGFEPVLENHRIAMNANSVYDAWFPCVTQTVRSIFIAGAVYIGARIGGMSPETGLSIGAISAAADLFIRLFEPIEAVASELLTIQQAMAGIDRAGEFFAHAEEKTERSSGGFRPSGASVEVRNLSFSYSAGQPVLDGLSLRVPQGAKAAIVGRTGSGKSTLLHLIAGMYGTESGGVLIGGVDPYRLAPQERRRWIGIVPQTVHIFNGNLLENITLRDTSIGRERVERALETTGLAEAVGTLPEGMETMLGEGGFSLSFGQTQLVALARALVTDPPLLLLDELTSGLDAVTESKLFAALRAIEGERTIVTISHRLSGILDADVVHIMERGKIRESGAPEELASKEGWYARYKRLEESGWRMA